MTALESLDLRTKLRDLASASALHSSVDDRLESRLGRLENLTYALVQQVAGARDKVRQMEQNVQGEFSLGCKDTEVRQMEKHVEG